MRTAPRLLAFVLVVAATACGDDADTGSPTTTADDATTTTTDDGTTTTTASLPGGDLATCINPEGFAIAHPADWQTNSGEVVSECSQFSPEPFEVEEGTDLRVAPITAFVESVPFATVAAPEDGRDADRAVTVIDGMQAVRLSFETTDDHLYGAGVPITMYAVDLSPGVDDGPGTLILDAVGFEDFDHEMNVQILDRMARTVGLRFESVPHEPGVIARYEGGGGAFTVTAEQQGNQICLRIPPEGEPACIEPPADDGIATTTITDLNSEYLVGVAGPGVQRVTAERTDTPLGYLPAPVEGGDVRAFAFAFGPDAIDQLTWSDLSGDELGRA